MNKELEEKIDRNASLLGYEALVKAIRKCDKEIQDEINKEYNSVISNLYSESNL